MNRQGFSRVSTQLMVLLVLSGHALAQQATDTSTAAAPSPASSLQEVTVTATRREESVQNVPISIAAITQGELTASGAVSIADIAAMTPGLQFDLAYPGISTYTTIAIRGMNANIGASVIGVYIDDTPIMVRLPANGGAGAAFPVVFDMSSVEVDRGPQGVLFGSSSEGGAVRFITNQPSLTQFSGEAHGQFGWTQGGALSYEAAAAAGGPIIDNEVGFRISAWQSTDGGYIDRIQPYPPFGIVGRDTNRTDKTSLRAAFAFQVTDDLKITPAVFYQTTYADNSGQFTDNLSDPSAGHFYDSRLIPETSGDRFILPTLKIEWHPAFADLIATTSYWHRHLDVIFDATGSVGTFGIVHYGNPLGPDFPTSPADLAPGLSPQYEKFFTQEVRLTSKQEGFISWVAGIYYNHSDQSDVYALYSNLLDPILPNPVGTPILYDYQLNADDQIALYANLDFHLTKQWTVSLGERIAKVTTDQINTAAGALNAGVPNVTTSARETPSLPRAVISYQVDPANMVYFSAARGFRVGGGNAALPLFCHTPVPPSYNPDSDWSFEVGAKDQFLNGRLQLDTSVFHVIWSQIQQEISVGSCGGLPYIANAGQAIVNGIDLALQAVVTDHLRFNLSAGYANAYFDETVFNSPGVPLVVSGDKVGYPPQVNPPWDVDATANYDWPLTDSTKLYLRVEDQYHSHNPGPFRTGLSSGPAYFPQLASDPATNLVNLRLGSNLSKWDISLYLDNVLNSHPLLGKFLWSTSSTLVAYDTFRPRTVGLTANVPF